MLRNVCSAGRRWAFVRLPIHTHEKPTLWGFAAATQKESKRIWIYTEESETQQQSKKRENIY